MSRLLVAQRALTVPGWAKNALWRSARAVPSLDLRFAENNSLVDAVTGASLVTFTRASSGTFVGSNGVLQNAVTNLLLRSEEIGTSPWGTNVSGSVTYTANATAAPTGAVTADRVTATADFAGPNQFISAVSGLNYALSFYIKAVTPGALDAIRMECFSGRFAQFNITTGAFSGVNPAITPSSIPVGDGWVRVQMLFAAPSTGSLAVAIYANTSSDFYLWGAQLEQSATVGEYVPTTSAINSAPRFDHNPTTGESLGLLVEEQRTNLLLQSNAFTTTWSNTDAVATATQTTAPDGTNAGWKLATGTGNTNHNIFQSIAFTAVATTASVFVKYLDHRWVGIRIGSGASQFFGSWDLQNGVVGSATAGATIGMQAVGNGWYRLTLTATLTSAGNANCIIGLNNADAIALTTYAGTGTGIYIFGAQLEAGAFPTSYIPTTTAAATRSADVASITGTAFSGWYRQDEGTMFADVNSAPVNTITQLAVDITDAGGSERMFIRRAGSGLLGFAVVDGGVTQADVGAGSVISGGARFAMAAAYRLNSINLASNGQIGTEDTSATIPTLDRMFIAQNFASTQQVNGTIRRLAFFSQRLPNSTLQTLTQ